MILSYIRKTEDETFKGVDALERFFDSQGLKRAIWIVLLFSAIYFGPVIFNIINR